MPSKELEQIMATMADATVGARRDHRRTARGNGGAARRAAAARRTPKSTKSASAHCVADWVTMPNSAQSTRRVVSARRRLFARARGVRTANSRHGSRAMRRRVYSYSSIDWRPNIRFPRRSTTRPRRIAGCASRASRRTSIAIAGDSAGGGLTLATLLALRDAGDALPACAVCLSPWTDLEGTGASAQPGGADDPMVPVAALRDMGRMYAGDSLRNPLAAPLLRQLQGVCRRC